MQQRQRVSNFHHFRREKDKQGNRNREDNSRSREKQSCQQYTNDATYYTTFSSCKRDNDFSNKIKDNYLQSRCDYNIQKFTPSQKIPHLFQQFQQMLIQLLQKSPPSLTNLSNLCIQTFQNLRNVLTHYQSQNHLPSYFYQMHHNSTQTKKNLLKMLQKQQQGSSQAQREIEELKNQVKKLNRIIQCKDEVYQGAVGKRKELEDRVKDMGAVIEAYERDESELKGIIQEKNRRIKQLEDKKQNLKKDLNEIQFQIQTLNFIGDQNENMPNGKQNKKSCKIIGLKVPSERKIRQKQKQNTKKSRFKRNQQENDNIDEDMYRFLAIQASTIEQYLYEEQQAY